MSRNVAPTVGAILRRNAVEIHREQLRRPLGLDFLRTAATVSRFHTRAPLFLPPAVKLSRTITSPPPSSSRILAASVVISRIPTRPALSCESVTAVASLAWRRSKHTKARKIDASGRRHKSNGRNKKNPDPTPTGSAPKAELSPNPKPTPQAKQPIKPPPAAPETTHHSLLERLPQSLPHFHRPTKDELLAAATGFWSRAKVHFKWLTIRSSRPFNADDISAFFSWILVGHVIWIIVGTTTFFSLGILLINTVFAQGMYTI